MPRIVAPFARVHQGSGPANSAAISSTGTTSQNAIGKCTRRGCKGTPKARSFNRMTVPPGNASQQECLDPSVAFGARHLRHIFLLYARLQQRLDTFITEQGCAGTVVRSDCRAHSPDTHFERITPSISSNSISSRD